MAVDFVTIANGQSVSSAYFIQRGDRPLVIVFPSSCAAADYRVQCATSSGASAAGDQWGDVLNNIAAQAPISAFTVVRAGALGFPIFARIDPPPTPFIRLKSGASHTLTCTFSLMTGIIGN